MRPGLTYGHRDLHRFRAGKRGVRALARVIGARAASHQATLASQSSTLGSGGSHNSGHVGLPTSSPIPTSATPEITDPTTGLAYAMVGHTLVGSTDLIG